MPQLKENIPATTAGNSPAMLIRRWAPWILTAQMAISILLAVISKYPWFDYLRDDFFYYLIVAQNFASGHGSTFNGHCADKRVSPAVDACSGRSEFVHAQPRSSTGFCRQ